MIKDAKGEGVGVTGLSKKGHGFSQLSYDTIGACIEVQSQLGVHCMEVDYQRALELALGKRGLRFEREVEVPIAFDGVTITKRRVDFVIGDGAEELILETKARSVILAEDVEQCLLYLQQGGFAGEFWAEAPGRATVCTYAAEAGAGLGAHAREAPLARVRAALGLTIPADIAGT